MLVYIPSCGQGQILRAKHRDLLESPRRHLVPDLGQIWALNGSQSEKVADVGLERWQSGMADVRQVLQRIRDEHFHLLIRWNDKLY